MLRFGEGPVDMVRGVCAGTMMPVQNKRDRARQSLTGVDRVNGQGFEIASMVAACGTQAGPECPAMTSSWFSSKRVRSNRLRLLRRR